MAVSTAEVSHNQQLIAAGVAPVPYSLVPGQVQSGRGGTTTQPGLKTESFATSEFNQRGFRRATYDFYTKHVTPLKQAEQMFWLKWDAIYKDTYGGNQSAFASEQLHFMSADIAAIYQMKGNVEMEAAHVTNNWSKIESQEWKDIHDQEDLIDMNGNYYKIADLISSKGVDLLIKRGATEDQLNSRLTKQDYIDVLHTLPADTYEVISYERPNFEKYNTDKFNFISKIIGKTSIEDKDQKIVNNSEQLLFALSQWNNHIIEDPALERVHNYMYNRYLNNVEARFYNLTDKQITELNQKRSKFQELGDIGFDKLTPNQRQLYRNLKQEVIEYDYSGVAESPIFENSVALLRNNWEGNMIDKDYGAMLNSLNKAKSPNNNLNDGVSTSTLDIARRKDWGALNKRTAMTTGSIIKTTIGVDIGGWEYLERTKDEIYGRDSDFTKIGAQINFGGGIEFLSKNLDKDSNIFWNNADDYNESYLKDEYKTEIDKVLDDDGFETSDGKYKVEKILMPAKRRGAIGYSVNEYAQKDFYNVTDPDGEVSNMSLPELLKIVLSDNDKLRVGAVDYITDYGVKTGVISTNQYKDIMNNKNISYQKTLTHMQEKEILVLSLEGNGKYLPGNLDDANPGYKMWDFTDGKQKTLNFSGIMMFGDDLYVGLSEGEEYVSSNILVSLDNAKKYKIPRVGDPPVTINKAGYPTFEDWSKDHWMEAGELIKAIRLSYGEDKATEIISELNGYYIVDVPILVTNTMYEDGDTEIKSYKQKRYSEDESETESGTVHEPLN